MTISLTPPIRFNKPTFAAKQNIWVTPEEKGQGITLKQKVDEYIRSLPKADQQDLQQTHSDDFTLVAIRTGANRVSDAELKTHANIMAQLNAMVAGIAAKAQPEETLEDFRQRNPGFVQESLKKLDKLKKLGKMTGIIKDE